MPNFQTTRNATDAMLLCILSMWFCSAVFGQVDRQKYLDMQPIAEASVQMLAPPQSEPYSRGNQVMFFQTAEEDPLSFYTRTQDGEWLIPAQVDRDDPWVRLLIFGPARPTIVDVAIEINQHPFRQARELWIDKLLAEAKKTFLERTDAAASEVAGKPEEESEEEPEEESKEQIPMVDAQSRQASTLFKRLINYLAADPSTTDREASREELRWLLAEWTGGPALLTLSPALAWRRAEAAPLWLALDRNGDQTLSREEIQQTVATFKQADSNRDEIVDLKELERFGKEHAPRGQTQGHALVVVLDEHTDWKALSKELRHAYGRQTPRADFLSLPAEVVYRVSFAKEEAKVTLLALQDSASDSWQLHSSTEQVITVGQPEAYLELSAAQGKVDADNTSGDMQQTQIALGAVVDGNPLLRLLDQDNNKRLTLREQRNAENLLTTLDRNHDGQLDRREIPTAIRLGVTHGPQVHQHLAKAIAAQGKHGDPINSSAPAWFVGMDRNQDGDLSKREFQGSPAQFAKFDRDGDGLINGQEAQ